MNNTSSIKKRWAQWSSILIIVIGIAVGVSLLPKGYSEDLTVIGSGKNVAVLVHNKEGVRSMNLMNQIDVIRERYKGRIEFRIAESGSPKGAEFAKRNMANDATLVLFKGDGTTVARLANLDSAESLAQKLDEIFGY